MFYQLNDRQSDLRLLDETRRYYVKREPVLAAVRERVKEMKAEIVLLEATIEAGFKKYDVPKEKGLAKLARLTPYEQMTDELRDIVIAHQVSKTLELVLRDYESMLEICDSPHFIGLGTIIAPPANITAGGEIALSASDWRSIFTPFDGKAFAAIITRDMPAPAVVGVGTALRSHSTFGRPQSPLMGEMGHYPAEPISNVESLKE